MSLRDWASRAGQILWRNKGLKLFSLFLAILLWVNLVSRGRSSKELDEIAWQIANLPADMEIVSRSAEKISIRVSGLSTTLQHLSSENMVLDLELPTGASPGEKTLYLSEKDIPLPRGVSVTKIDPVQLSLVLERKLQREVPVRPILRGAPLPGFRFESYSIQPQSVLIEGAESQISRVREVLTAPIPLEGLRRSTRGTINLQLPDPIGGPEREGTLSNLRFPGITEVSYELILDEARNMRILTVPVRLPPEAAWLELEPDRVLLLLEGEQGALERLRGDQIPILVEPLALEAGETVLVQPHIGELPRGLRWIECLTDLRLRGQAAPQATPAAGQEAPSTSREEEP